MSWWQSWRTSLGRRCLPPKQLKNVLPGRYPEHLAQWFIGTEFSQGRYSKVGRRVWEKDEPVICHRLRGQGAIKSE